MTINFGQNAKREYVSPHALQIIEKILRASGLTSCLITSTARTPADQARVMYNNIFAEGAAKQKALYAAAGDAVIDVYIQAHKAQKTPSQIKAAMEAKIIEIGPDKVSRHCADWKKLVVVDIAPSSIGNKALFEKSVISERGVSKFLLPPLDPAYHLEIPVSDGK
jgi:hypothetical protein